MQHQTSYLNNDFGICIDDVTKNDLHNSSFQAYAYELWVQSGGLLAIRGANLVNISPVDFISISNSFGKVEQEMQAARDDKSVDGYPILRIGNVKNDNGDSISQFAQVPKLSCDADIQYNPKTKRPVWHTDSTFRKKPPIGSVFHCRKAPSSGGETLFADTRTAFEYLDEEKKHQLEKLEAICSLAHHDKKINTYSPDYPTLTPEQRLANPPMRVPLVLTHPVTGKRALYGVNSSTCSIVPIGEKVCSEDLDYWDLEGCEDESVSILRDLLPHVTGPNFTVKWSWRAGDIVIWDNRCTIHAATGFDHDNEQREMWRVTLHDKE